MNTFIVFCVLFALAQGASINNRIVGGEDAELGQFPYIASLRYYDSHFCGASIISQRTLLTAAHCNVYNDIEAVVGTTLQNDQSARRYKVKSFIIHPDYNPNTITNDVAVVILDEDIVFTDNVQPIPLASRPVKDDERLTSSGWGLTTYPGSIPDKLQCMQMNVMNPDECESITGQIVTGKICTLENPGKGICSGDSGGPLANEEKEIVGVTSAAYLCALGLPDFFTDVYYFRDWINKNTV